MYVHDPDRYIDVLLSDGFPKKTLETHALLSINGLEFKAHIR